MKLKLLLVGIALLFAGFVIAAVSCTSGTCPGDQSSALAGFLLIGGLVITPVAVGWSLYDRRKRTPAPSPLASEPAELLDNLSKRLASNGFEIQRDVDLRPYHLDLVAVRSRFELSKFGKMTRFMLVAKVSDVDASMVQDYSSRTTKYALDNPHTGLPRGLGRGVLSIPVLVSEDFDDEVKRLITETLAPKHWAAFEFPVLISTRLRQLYYCKKTPVWGAAYYRGFRHFVETQIGSQRAESERSAAN